jgi:molybdopterin molybdotransferase
MLSVSQAIAAVLEHCFQGPSERLPLAEGLSRILAEDLVVPHDSPPFDKALMDGFAVVAQSRREPLTDPGADSQFITLPIVETVTAGHLPSVSLDDQHASRIMTGASLPEGCNCVVPIELTQFDEGRSEYVSIPVSAMSSEANVMRRGAAAREGSTLLNSGIRLQPQHIAALAEFGFGSIHVTRRPRIAVLATGDELTAFDQTLQPGCIRNSNEPMLVAQIQASDAIAVPLGIARDDESQLTSCIQLGLQHDFLLLTGGVSAGLLDLVPQQLRNAGVQQIFHGVHMKPGKPLWFGTFEDSSRRCLVFGLPGNPVSSLACFELFVRPALESFSGRRLSNAALKAVLAGSFQVKGNRPVYQPVTISVDDGRLMARPVPWTSSSDLRATVEANGMALLLPEHGHYNGGEVVEIHLWGEQRIVPRQP